MEAKAREAMILMRQHVMFFHEADKMGNLCLEFDEFEAELPDLVRQKHSQQELLRWFRLADKDGRGSITMAKFVEWSVTMARMVTACDVLTGMDEVTFTTRLARDMGFGDHAQELFAELAIGRNGTDDCSVLADRQGGPSHMPKRDAQCMREFLVAMGWNSTKDVGQELDTRGWEFGEGVTDLQGLASALKTLLERHRVKLSQVFELMDANDNNFLNQTEFVAGLFDLLGFRGERSILVGTFAALDDDSSGKLTFDEVHAWMHGRQKRPRAERMALARSLTFRPPDAHDTEAWDVERLRSELNRALSEAGVKLMDLLDTWDADGSGELRKREWLVNFKHLAAALPELVWYRRVRDAVCDAFLCIDRDGEGAVSIGEFDRWLRGKSPASLSSARRRASPQRRQRLVHVWDPLVSLEKRSSKTNARLWRSVEQSQTFRRAAPEGTPATPIRDSRKPDVPRASDLETWREVLLARRSPHHQLGHGRGWSGDPSYDDAVSLEVDRRETERLRKR
jgi:Ca2+-binding EF-hand superfamily protein